MQVDIGVPCKLPPPCRGGGESCKFTYCIFLLKFLVEGSFQVPIFSKIFQSFPFLAYVKPKVMHDKNNMV